MNFFVSNLIAFYMHQILKMSNEAYNQARAKVSSLIEFWNRLRGLINSFVLKAGILCLM